jgi:uncharacterized protein (TIGR02001 family)
VTRSVKWIDVDGFKVSSMRRVTLMKTILMTGALLITVMGNARAYAADINWGGSLGLTTDYLVRGISRSDHEPSLQAEVHRATTKGWMAGLFTSTTRIAPGQRRDVEIGVFAGRAWNWNADWSSKVQLSHYSYPLNQAGSDYDYNELSLEASFRDWLSVGVVWSPDAPRYVAYEGLIASTAVSGELNLQTPAWHKLTLYGGSAIRSIRAMTAMSSPIGAPAAPWT